MERLTKWDEYGNADIVALSDVMAEIYAELSFGETNALTNALNRLAAYEDTGLTPEGIMAMIPAPNDPLTLDELREMDGEPIFLKRPGYCDRWGLVQVREGLTDNVYFTFNNGTSVLARLELKYGKAYRRKLEIL